MIMWITSAIVLLVTAVLAYSIGWREAVLYYGIEEEEDDLC